MRILPYLIEPFIDCWDSFAIQRASNMKAPLALFIKPDAIGDYILCRNFLPFLKESERFKGISWIWVGQPSVMGLSKYLDADIFNEWIPVNSYSFRRNPIYRKRISDLLASKSSVTALSPLFSRVYYLGDSLVKASGAYHKIAPTTDALNFYSERQELLSNSIYTECIDVQINTSMFEFERMKLFFETLLHQKIPIQAPFIEKEKLPIVPKALKLDVSNPYVVVFPGAGVSFRRWPIDHFADICKEILVKGFEVFIGGGPEDAPLASYIQGKLGEKNIHSGCGGFTLPEFLTILSHSKGLVSNETGAVHMAAALGVPSFCISSGNHFGRFHPYPKFYDVQPIYHYPSSFKSKSFKALVDMYGRGSTIPMSSISKNDVFPELSDFLSAL